jgi:hypothetical protein
MLALGATVAAPTRAAVGGELFANNRALLTFVVALSEVVASTDTIRATCEGAVDYLYSLYDALVSINVPNDKARAVVDAMERDMGTTLATKTDLQFLRQEFRQEMALTRKDMEILGTSVTVRLGSIVVVGLGILFAALKLT